MAAVRSLAEVMRQKIAVLKDHCTAVGRNYDDIRKTFSLRVNLAKTKAEAEKLTGGKPMRPEDPPSSANRPP
ncbi:MAG: hypothetical protein U0232_20490 [Thermomicrobiales bacterium]